MLFLQLQKNAREQFARWNACRNSPDRSAIILSPRDFDRCHHTSYKLNHRVGVAMNCPTAMEHPRRIYNSMPVSWAAKILAPSSARVVPIISLAMFVQKADDASSPTARHGVQASVDERPIVLPPATGGSHVRHRYRAFPYWHRKVRVQGRDCTRSRNGKSLALCG